MAVRNFELMKNTVILSIGQIIPKLIAIFVLPLLTTYLSKSDYGLYELTLSVGSFCIPLLSVQIQQAVFRFLIIPDSNRKDIISSSLFFVVAMFIVASVPIVVAWFLYSHDTILGVLFFGAYFSEVLMAWAGQVTRGVGNNLVYSFAYVIYSLIFVAFLLLFLQLTGSLTAKNVAVAMICAYAVAIIFLFGKVKIHYLVSLSHYSQNTLNLLLSYSAPMVISSVALWVVNLSDRFFVSGYLGIEITALYSVANRIPNLFNSMYNIFNLAWTENTSKLTDKEKKEGYYTEFFKTFYQIMVGMMLLLISISPFLFRVLINSQYADAYGLMSWLYVGAFFSSLVAFFGSIYVGEKRTKDVGISSAIGAIINVLINLIFMRQFGVLIAAISTIISYLIICIYRAIDIKQYVKINYKISYMIIGILVICIVAIINYSYSLITTIISCVIASAYNVIFNRTIIKNIYVGIIRKLKGK